MGQSSNKPIDMSENLTESEHLTESENLTESELQLENVDERKKLVEIRSEDLQAYKDLLIKVIEQNVLLEDRVNDLMNCIEELKTDNALMVTQIDNHNTNSILRNNKDADAPDSGIARNSLASEYSITEENSSRVESPTEDSLKSLQLLLATLTAKVEIGFKKLDSLVLSGNSSPSRPPPPPPPLPPQETTRALLNIVQRSISVGGSRQCVEISVQDALIAEINNFHLRRARARQSNQNLSNIVEREVASEPNKKIS